MRFQVVALKLITIFQVLALSGCAFPKASDVLKQALNCKADITVPEDYRTGEPMTVDVRIYDCKEESGVADNTGSSL